MMLMGVYGVRTAQVEAEAAQVPVNFGLRFSMKARRPSM
jgi:hypothetical protein